MKNLIILLIFLCFISCEKDPLKEIALLDAKNFTDLIDEKNVSLYTLESGNGIYMQVTNLGARIVSLWLPDRKGNYDDIIFGYENIDKYISYSNNNSFDPTTNTKYDACAHKEALTKSLFSNNNIASNEERKNLNALVWEVDKISKNEIRFSYFSSEDEGSSYGKMRFEMSYLLTPENEFKITYKIIIDKPVIINLSNLGLFNLKGEGNGTITDQILTINADDITLMNDSLIQITKCLPVENTPFDFRTPSAICNKIDSNNEQLKKHAGYDHNWIVSNNDTHQIKHLATLYEPQCGRMMEVWSDQPGIQFYSGNFIDKKVKGKYGKTLKYREVMALETIKSPETFNSYGFSYAKLLPGKTYGQTCIYKFTTK